MWPKASSSAADTHEGSRFECLQVAEQIGNEKSKIGIGSAARHQYKNRKWQSNEILLVLKILVCGDQGIERRRCHL